jgi:hypothetical protein
MQSSLPALPAGCNATAPGQLQPAIAEDKGLLIEPVFYLQGTSALHHGGGTIVAAGSTSLYVQSKQRAWDDTHEQPVLKYGTN